MKEKERLDVLLVNRGLAPSREKAKTMIMAGDVFVENQREDKAGSTFLPEYACERDCFADSGAVGDLFAVQELIQSQIQDEAHLAVELADRTVGIAAGDVLQCEQAFRHAVVQHGAEALVGGVQVRRIERLIEQQVGIAARRERPQQQPDCK